MTTDPVSDMAGLPASRWASALAEWAIPPDVLAAAPESPWCYPMQVSAAAAEAAMAADTPSRRAATGFLGEGGAVLDVGCGAGAASLPLANRAGRIVGVDASRDMLDAFAAGADRLGVDHDEVLGAWPDVGDEAPVADVVVCHHVLYNVAPVVPFVLALAAHARRGVVVEITDRHPQSALNPLWLHFHGLVRPETPTSADLVDVLRDEGLAVVVERSLRSRPFVADDPEAVAFDRRRLCLPAFRDPEVADMRSRFPDRSASDVATLSWRVG